MSLKHGILGLLNYGSMTGYELSRVFKDSLSFFWQAQTSQIYRELNAMERGGWLASERIVQTDKPNKRVYALTPAGKTELERWLGAPDADIREAMTVRSAFLMRMFFAGETGDAETLAMLCAFREKCLEAAASLGGVSGLIDNYGSAELGGQAKYWKIVALFGESYYRAEIEWAERAMTIIEGDA